MKNKASVKKAAAIVAAAVLIVICGGCKNETLKGKTLFIDDGSLSEPDVSSWVDHNHNVSFFGTDSGPFSDPNAKEEFSVEFMDNVYTGKYDFSRRWNDKLSHRYKGDDFVFWVDYNYNPEDIWFDDRNPMVPEDQLKEIIPDEELIESANKIFDRYCNDKSIINSKPIVEMNEYSQFGLIEREYRVKYYYNDERIRRQLAFEIIFSSEGEVLVSPVSFILRGPIIVKDLSYDFEAIKAEIMKRCQPIIDNLNEKDWLEFISIEISDGRIDYVYVDNKEHVGLYSEVTISYKRETSYDVLEKENVPKYMDDSERLTFVTVLD